MSRLTSAQVIELGHYLDPTFDPSTLTVSQLLGIFIYHSIPYPSQYTKLKLIRVFEEHITANLAKLLKERTTRQNCTASDDGIVDGATGEPLSRLPVHRQSVWRSSRRASGVYSEDANPDSSGAPAEMANRQRSTAQRRLGDPTIVISKAPTVAEESARNFGRKRKDGGVPGSKDSGWEVNNIFQSGARPTFASRPSHKSQSCKSTSTRRSETMHPPSRTAFSSEIVDDVVQESKLTSTRWSSKTLSTAPLLAEDDEMMDNSTLPPLNLSNPRIMDPPQEIEEESAEEANSAITERTSDESYAIEFAQRIKREDKGVIRPRQLPYQPPPHSPRRRVRRTPLTLCLLLFSALSYNYQKISSTIGFCDPNSDTNNALEAYRSLSAAVEACNEENRTYLDVEESQLCPAPALFPLAEIISCTPCPAYATCAQFSVTCSTGYVMKSHPLLRLLSPFGAPSTITPNSKSTSADALWKDASFLDGFPGLGSVALPPRCVKDTQRELRIGALAEAMQRHLAEVRGMRLCGGGDLTTGYPASEGGEARQWGTKEDDLRTALKENRAQHLPDTHEELFEEAAQLLMSWSDAIISADYRGERYYASTAPYLSFGCIVTVKTREVVHISRSAVIVFSMSVAIILFGRREMSRRKNESKHVAELVLIALNSLRNQELSHHVDPVTASVPYLSSLQLRDLVLQDEHSIATRRRLWDRVERVVEGNVNVRASLEETASGDEMRVWRWIGAVARQR